MFGRRGKGPESAGPKKTPEQPISPRILEMIKNAHVIGWPMEAYHISRQEGSLEAVTEKVKERIREYLSDTINEYHSIRDIGNLGEAFNLSIKDFETPKFRDAAIELLGRAADKALHVYGFPENVDIFVRFMGGSKFAQDQRVRKSILNAMSKKAGNFNSITLPSAFQALIKTFKFTDSELNSFVTPDMKEKIKNAPDAYALKLEADVREKKREQGSGDKDVEDDY